MEQATLRIFAPAQPDMPARQFLTSTYAVQNMRLAVGSEATLEDYVTQLNNLQAYFDELLKEAKRPVLLCDLTDSLVAACMKWLIVRGRSPATANKFRAAIVAIVNFAIGLELPLRPLRTKKIPLPKRKTQCWLPDEVLLLLRAARRAPGTVGPLPAGDWLYALELFILNTGTRISATMHTPTSGLDLDRGRVIIPAEVQKHDADEEFELLPATIAALRQIRPQRNGVIFGDWPYDRNVRQWPTLTRWQKRVVVAAGLRPTVKLVTRKDCFHRLRRSFATFVNYEGGKELARELMGHSHQKVTDVYLDVRMSREKKVANLLEKYLPPVDSDQQLRLFD